MIKSPYDCKRVSSLHACMNESNGSSPDGIRLSYLGKAVRVEYKGMQQLAERERHHHPASKPPRPHSQLAILLAAPDHAPVLQVVPPKLHGPERRVDRHGQTQLLRGIDPERQAGHRSADGGGVYGGDGACHGGVALPEGLRGGVEDDQPQPRKEAEQEAIQQQDRAEG